jgi:hypothetical protein
MPFRTAANDGSLVGETLAGVWVMGVDLEWDRRVAVFSYLCVGCFVFEFWLCRVWWRRRPR